MKLKVYLMKLKSLKPKHLLRRNHVNKKVDFSYITKNVSHIKRFFRHYIKMFFRYGQSFFRNNKLLTSLSSFPEFIAIENKEKCKLLTIANLFYKNILRRLNAFIDRSY